MLDRYSALREAIIRLTAGICLQIPNMGHDSRDDINGYNLTGIRRRYKNLDTKLETI